MKDFIIRLDDQKYKCMNIESSSKYYVPDSMSINVYYPHKVMLMSSHESINISLESGQEVFRLLDINKHDELLTSSISSIDYIDIDDIVSYNIESTGKLVDEMYLHNIYIILRGSSVAEYDVEMELEYPDSSVILNIISSFYPQVEEYEVNLRNIGVRLNQNITKAIYEGDVHDEDIDYILLNRKYKELLMCGLDIIDRKGSYKSLIDAFNWFGYRDIAHLREYWSQPENNRLYYQDINTIYDKTFNDITARAAQSTYISIYSCLNEYSGEYETDNKLELQEDGRGILPEPSPILKDIIYDISEMDLKLKLILLGNFYSTYFLPIHIDLLNSTVERISIPSINLKYNSIASYGVQTLINNLYNFTCNIDETYTMNNINVSSLMHTPGRMDTDDTVMWDDYCSIGVVPISEIKSDYELTDDDYNIFTANYYNGVGGLIPIEITPTTTDIIQSVHIILSTEYGDIYNKIVPIYKYNGDTMKMYISIKKSGNYTIHITPIGLSNQYTTKIYNTSIIPPSSVQMNVVLLKEKPIYSEIINKSYVTYSDINKASINYDTVYFNVNDDYSITFNEYPSSIYSNLLVNKNNTLYNNYIHTTNPSLCHNTITLLLDSKFKNSSVDEKYLDLLEDGNWEFKVPKYFYKSGDGENYEYYRDLNISIGEDYKSSKDLLDVMNNMEFISSYKFWVKTSLVYNGITDVEDGLLYNKGSVVGYISDRKQYINKSYLIGLRIKNNGVVSEDIPMIKCGDSSNIITNNTSELFYKNTYIPVMWEDYSNTQIIPDGSLFRLDPSITMLTGQENNISYKLYNKSTKQYKSIVRLSNPLLANDSSSDYNNMDTGVYDIIYYYTIPDISGDKSYEYNLPNAFIIS